MKGIAGLFLLVALLFSTAGRAQNSRETAGEQNVRNKKSRQSAGSLHSKKKYGKSRKSKFSYADVYDQKIREYEERMQAAVKQREKDEREMKKPQYSDPAFFGHKRKPKKRPPGKKKYCKECGLYH